MTYQINRYDDTWELLDANGSVIASGSYPLNTPDDILDAILDDMGVGKPQKEAFKVLFKRDWEIVDDR